MKREDALFNWLQIQVVAEARPDDQSALDTAAFLPSCCWRIMPSASFRTGWKTAGIICRASRKRVR